jgi:hypothetical protein
MYLFASSPLRLFASSLAAALPVERRVLTRPGVGRVETTAILSSLHGAHAWYFRCADQCNSGGLQSYPQSAKA